MAVPEAAPAARHPRDWVLGGAAGWMPERRARVGRRSSQMWRDRRVLRAGWPLAALCLGMPLWFFLGAAAFVWAVPGIVILTVILARPDRFRVPQGGLLLGGFCLWSLVSVAQLGASADTMLAGYRWLLYLSTFGLYLWVANTPARVLPSAAISDWLAILFLVVIAGGYLGLVLGDLTFISPLQRVLPGEVGTSDFIASVSTIHFAEVQSFLGYPVPRPSAPFAYTNGWGSTVGLLVPFFLASFFRSPVARRRRWAVVISGVALVPAIVSMNRGLWISVTASLVYISIRRAAGGDWRLARAVIGGLAILVTLTVTTPLKDLVSGKLEGAEASNDTRGNLYELAFDGAREQPLLGNGTPTPRGGGPPVGTHGLAWFIMYCHGFVALGLFVGWMARVLWLGRGIRSEPEMWAHLSLVVLLCQFLIYGLLPQLPLAGVAAGMVHRYRFPPGGAGVAS